MDKSSVINVAVGDLVKWEAIATERLGHRINYIGVVINLAGTEYKVHWFAPHRQHARLDGDIDQYSGSVISYDNRKEPKQMSLVSRYIRRENKKNLQT